jgi:hypothetical protein
MSNNLPPSNDPKFKKVTFDLMDPTGNSQDPLGQIFSVIKKSQDLDAIKLSFSEDPMKTTTYGSVFKSKATMVPNALLKRARDTEELIGGIIMPLRAKQISLFGHPRANRFDIGVAVNIRPEVYEKKDEKEIDRIKKEVVPVLRELLLNCGSNKNIKDRDKCTFSQYLHQITEDMLLYGWFTTEVRKDSSNKFHSFRATDAGTIYYGVPSKEDSREMANVRKQAKQVLEKLQGHHIPIDAFAEGDYTWVQVIDEIPRQVFTDDQMIAWSLNPSTDINRSGYPVSPIERMLSSVTTHINLTTHNKMFFLNGKAARNIMIFQSENLDEGDIANIRAQMQAHINSANAAWRMPVFGIGANDSIEVKPLDSAGRDMEFQYLADLNKRMILAAFQMSPDEIAALSYLSKGTNSQALSESSNEWKLVKSQESGLRPILLSIEDFLNERLLPRINPEWAGLVRIALEGLDADSPEKEATRLQQDSAIYLTMNEILDRVEKERLPLAGDFPLNAAYMQTLEKYFTMGQILEAFEPSMKGAASKPEFQFYIGNQAWFSFMEMQQQQQMMQQQAQMQQQQQLQSGQPGQPPQQGQPGQPNQTAQPDQPDLDTALGQLEQSLTKSEERLPPQRKELLKLQRQAKIKIMEDFEKNSKKAMDEIIAAIDDSKDE